MGIHLATNPWIWVAFFFTLCVYSFLYKDNIFFKLAESVTVGISMGYFITQWWDLSVKGKFWTPLSTEGRWDLIFPAILGLLMVTRIIPKLAWLSRYALALTIGAGAGIGLPLAIQGVYQQLYGTMLPINLSWIGLGHNLVIVVGVLACLIYFFFSKEHKGVFGVAANIGIWFLMVGFGATFGYTVMARLSLFIGRVLFILRDVFGYSVM